MDRYGRRPAEIIIEENAFHDGSDAVRIGGQYDHGTISIASNELTATIKNKGGHEDTQNVELEVRDGTYMVYEDETPLSLEAGETGAVTFSEKVEKPLTGYYNVVISTEEARQSELVEWPDENNNDNNLGLMGVEQEAGLPGFDEGL